VTTIELTTADDALTLLDRLDSLQLTTVQEQIIRGTWEGLTYSRMAQQSGYEPDYLKFVGSRLWRDLSQILGQPVSKSNLRATIQQIQRQRSSLGADSPAPPSLSIDCDWGDAPLVEAFYGRGDDLVHLAQWCKADRCRLIVLQGQGGIGKTTLARHLAQQMSIDSETAKDGFERVVWRSLSSAPAPLDLLKSLALAIDSPSWSHPPVQLRDWLSAWLERLTQHRHLIVLDNSESLLRPHSLTGDYLPGYDAYQQVFEQLGEAPHQSCVVLTGREVPSHFASLCDRHSAVRVYPVKPMMAEACRAVVKDTGVVCRDEESDRLCDRYGGNPLSLKLVATTIRDVFSGQVEPFLTSTTPLLGGVRQVLDEQFDRLLPLEQQVMYRLAIYREPMAIATLQSSCLHPPDLGLLVEALDSLWRRCLIETASPTLIEQAIAVNRSSNESSRFTQQPVIMEYVTRRLIEQVVAELLNIQRDSTIEIAGTVLHRYGLLTPSAPDYVCNTQKRLILQPILDRLVQHCESRKAVTHRLRCWVQLCRERLTDSSSYAGGNVINLLCVLDGTVENLDSSNLALWHVDVRGYNLRQCNLAGVHFQNTLFTETFGSVLCVAFDPTEQWLASGDTNGEIRLWNVSTGQLHQTLTGHSSWVRSLAFHPTHPWLVSASNDHTLKVWDWQTGQYLHTLTGHQHWVRDVAFESSSSSIPVMASSDAAGVVFLWNSETWSEIQHFSAHDQAVRAIAFGADGMLLTGSEDKTLKLWDLATKTCTHTFMGHEAAVYAVQNAASESLVFSGSADGEIRLWNIVTGQCQSIFSHHGDAVWALSLSADGDWLASASADSTIRVWNWQTGQCMRVLPGHQHWVLSVAFSPQSSWLASGGFDQTVRLWDSATGNPLRVLQGYTNGIFALTVDEQNGILVSGSHDGQVNQWDIHTSRQLSSIQAHASQLWTIALSADGQWMATGALESGIHLWHRATGECCARLETGSYWVRSLAFSSDHQWLVSAGTTNDILVWDLSNKKLGRSLVGHTDFTWMAIFSPDGQRLASCSNDATVRLWDWPQGMCQQMLQGHRGPVESLAFIPGGAGLASAGADGIIRLWDCATGAEIAQLIGHTDQIGRLAVSADGQWLASSSNDQTVRLWDVSSRQCVQVLEQPARLAYAIAFLPPPQTYLLATGDLDGRICLWDCHTGTSVTTWTLPRPYENLNIANVTGLTPAQQSSLRQLGAIARPSL